MDNIIIS